MLSTRKLRRTALRRIQRKLLNEGKSMEFSPVGGSQVAKAFSRASRARLKFQIRNDGRNTPPVRRSRLDEKNRSEGTITPR